MKRLLHKFASWIMSLLNVAYQQERFWMTKEEDDEWKRDRQKVYDAMRELE